MSSVSAHLRPSPIAWTGIDSRYFFAEQDPAPQPPSLAGFFFLGDVAPGFVSPDAGAAAAGLSAGAPGMAGAGGAGGVAPGGVGAGAGGGGAPVPARAGGGPAPAGGAAVFSRRALVP